MTLSESSLEGRCWLSSMVGDLGGVGSAIGPNACEYGLFNDGKSGAETVLLCNLAETDEGESGWRKPILEESVGLEVGSVS